MCVLWRGGRGVSASGSISVIVTVAIVRGTGKNMFVTAMGAREIAGLAVVGMVVVVSVCTRITAVVDAEGKVSVGSMVILVLDGWAKRVDLDMDMEKCVIAGVGIDMPMGRRCLLL